MSAREQALPEALERAFLCDCPRPRLLNDTLTHEERKVPVDHEPYCPSRHLPRLRDAMPAIRRELLAEAERDGAELHTRAAERFGSLVDAVVDQIAAGGSLRDVLEVVGDAANDCDYVDDDLIERWERAKTVASRPEPAAAERVEEAVRGAHLEARETAIARGYGNPTPAENTKAVLAAIRRLHFGAVAGEIRARRDLRFRWALDTNEGKEPCPMCFEEDGRDPGNEHTRACVYAALDQPPSASAAALEALLEAAAPFVTALEAHEEDIETEGGTHGLDSDEPHGDGLGEALTYGDWRSFQKHTRRLRKAVGWEES